MNFKFDNKYVIACIILIAANVLVYKNLWEQQDSRSDFFQKDFKTRISDWSAQDVIYDQNVLQTLEADYTVYKTYYNNKAQPVTLFMACYNSLEKADLSHSPLVCFTGQGWEFSKVSQQTIDVNGTSTNRITVNQILQKKLDQTMIVLYWYQSLDQEYSNRGYQKVAFFVDKLLGRPTNNAFVRLTVDVPDKNMLQKTESDLYSFVSMLYPEILNFFSDSYQENSVPEI